MSSNAPQVSSKKQDLTYFEKQRDLLISEISISMDSILNNLNSLNRSVESSIQVGKEFKSVSDLWGSFYDGINQVEELRSRNDEEQNQGDEINNPRSEDVNEVEQLENSEQNKNSTHVEQISKDADNDVNIEN